MEHLLFDLASLVTVATGLVMLSCWVIKEKKFPQTNTQDRGF